MILFLDMDEVLVDFVEGACQACGTTTKELLPFWPKGSWSMTEPMGNYLTSVGRWDTASPFPFTSEDFWSRIHKSEEFWINLKPMPHFQEVIDLADQYVTKGFFKEWYIISAPSRCDSSYSGKVKWLKNKFGNDFSRFLLTPHKYLLATRDRALLDDKDANVIDFKAADGVAITFPMHHNSLYALANDPMTYVRGRFALNFRK